MFCVLTILWLCFIFFAQSKVSDFCDPILLVIAHPDDECMFFGPIVQSLIRANFKVDLLCFSTGNYNNLGGKRITELRKASSIMKFRHLTILNTECFQDSPNSDWPHDKIVDLIHQTCKKYKSESLVSFDERGISGHPNHCSIGKALKSYKYDKELPRIFFVKTLPITRKYCFIIDFLFSLLCKENFVCTPFSQLSIPYLSMMSYKSQLVWFRWLYMLFSTYMYKNIIYRYS